MSALRHSACVAILALLSGWLSSPTAAQTPLGCDPQTINKPPTVDYLAAPQNLALLKQQLLIYRCTRYDNELAMVVQEAQAWIKLRAAQVSNPAIVLDIDETSLSNWNRIYQDEYYPFPSPCSFTLKCSDRDWQWTEQATAIEPVLNLYKLAQCIDVASSCSKIDVYFVTGRHEGDKYVPKAVCASSDQCDQSLLRSPREWTLANLQKAGFTGVTDDHLCMRPAAGQTTAVCPVTRSITTASPEPPVSTYKTDQRIAIEQLPKTIIANVGDQNSDLVGLHAERAFKLPNPFYFIP
jgi:acid phosphatase